jgi:hypothetical protein
MHRRIRGRREPLQAIDGKTEVLERETRLELATSTLARLRALREVQRAGDLAGRQFTRLELDELLERGEGILGFDISGEFLREMSAVILMRLSTDLPGNASINHHPAAFRHVGTRLHLTAVRQQADLNPDAMNL